MEWCILVIVKTIELLYSLRMVCSLILYIDICHILWKPKGLDFPADGNLHVAEYHYSNKHGVFTLAGKLVRSYRFVLSTNEASGAAVCLLMWQSMQLVSQLLCMMNVLPIPFPSLIPVIRSYTPSGWTFLVV